MSAQLTPLVEGFLRGCREQQLTPEQAAEAVKRACAVDETIAAEFEKAGLGAGVVLGGLGLAASLLPYFMPSSSGHKPEAPKEEPKQHTTGAPAGGGYLNPQGSYLQPHPHVTAGHTPNFYAPPGAGALGPQTMPSSMLPPGGLPMRPGYGPMGFPGVPFGAQPGNLPLPGMKSAAAEGAYAVLERLAEKKAFIGALGSGLAAAGRFGGSLLGKGLQGLGKLTGWQGAQNAGKALQMPARTHAASQAIHASKLEPQVQNLVARGLSPDQARQAVNNHFGKQTLADPAEYLRRQKEMHSRLDAAGLGNRVRGVPVQNANAQAWQAYQKDWAETNPGFWKNHGGTMLTAGMLGTMFMPMGGGAPPQYPDTPMEHQASYNGRSILARLADAVEKRASLSYVLPGTIIGAAQGAANDSTLEGAARGWVRGTGTTLGGLAGGTLGMHLAARRGLRGNLPRLVHAIGGHALGAVGGYAGTGALLGKPSWQQPKSKAEKTGSVIPPNALRDTALMSGLGGLLGGAQGASYSENGPSGALEGGLRGVVRGGSTAAGALAGGELAAHAARQAELAKIPARLRNVPMNPMMLKNIALSRLGGALAGGLTGYGTAGLALGPASWERKKAAVIRPKLHLDNNGPSTETALVHKPTAVAAPSPKPAGKTLGRLGAAAGAAALGYGAYRAGKYMLGSGEKKEAHNPFVRGRAG